MNTQIRSFAIAFIGIVLIGILSDGVFGHSYVTSPVSRSNQAQTQGGCRGPACTGPCDAPLSRARNPITISRGSSVTLNWPRNNHAGGFIRVAWAPTQDSDSMAAFDAGVQEYSCHERGGCKPDNAADPNGGDSAPSDGSFQPCSLSIVVPSHLTDGLWTLQWAWFGGAFSLGDYFSCVDYKISGGGSGDKAAPFFVGGDFTYPNQQKCKFFNTDRLHKCVNEPCNNPVFPAAQEQSGPVFGFSSSNPNPNPSPNPKPTPAVTTGKVQPASTGQQSSTSSSTSSSSGGSSTTAPVGGSTTSPVPTPVPVPAPVPSGSNCAGATMLSESVASLIQVDTWGTTVRAIIELKVRESNLANWNLQIIWPTAAVNTRVQNIYNAGMLSCEGTSPARHAMIKPVANWAKNLVAGTVLQIEVFASNSNGLNANFIQANTQIRVFSA